MESPTHDGKKQWRIRSTRGKKEKSSTRRRGGINLKQESGRSKSDKHSKPHQRQRISTEMYCTGTVFEAQDYLSLPDAVCVGVTCVPSFFFL
jgi:hypothetical protein